jgi:transposase
VDRLLPTGDHLILETHATSLSATCPLCDQPSTRPHSTYRRRLADLPWQGRTVERHRHTCFTLECLFRGSNFHSTSPFQINQMKT